MSANSHPNNGPGGHSPATVKNGPLIGVCWQPGQRVPTPILAGPDRPKVDGRYGIPASYGDDLGSRPPTHYEWHTLRMRPGEPVVELHRGSGAREVYPARLVGIIPTGSTMQVTRPDGSTLLLGEDAFCVIGSGADTPDPATPRWQRMVEDVHTDVAAGCAPATSCPPPPSSPAYTPAHHPLSTGRCAGSPRTGWLSAGPAGDGSSPRPRPAAAAGSEPAVDCIGIKHPPGAYYAIAALVTPYEVAAIPVSQDDILSTRAPNHLEARRLPTDPGEAVIDIRYADGTAEVYRSTRMVLRARGDILLPGATVPDGAAFRLTTDPVTGPDLRKPYWRHVYDDITDDIATGRLTTGARIGTVEQLADTWHITSPPTGEHRGAGQR